MALRDAKRIPLQAENQRLFERHVVWVYNAQVRGISEADWDRPLPPVHRGQTKIELRVSNNSQSPSYVAGHPDARDRVM